MNLNRGADRYERNKELADYAVNEGLLPHHPGATHGLCQLVPGSAERGTTAIRLEEGGLLKRGKWNGRRRETCDTDGGFRGYRAYGASGHGELITMDAYNASICLYWLLQSGLVEKPDKKRGTYQITERGREYRANPPQKPQEKIAKSVDESAAISAAISDGVGLTFGVLSVARHHFYRILGKCFP